LAGKITTGQQKMAEFTAGFMTKTPAELTAKRPGTVPSPMLTNQVWDYFTFTKICDQS